jgi:hypothetical protein
MRILLHLKNDGFVKEIIPKINIYVKTTLLCSECPLTLRGIFWFLALKMGFAEVEAGGETNSK